MTIYYHGTANGNALCIAKRGAILSPLEQDIELYQSDSELMENLKRGWPGMSLREVLISMKSSQYGTHELYHRLFCVSLTTDIGVAQTFAVNHGLIFGLEREEKKRIIFLPCSVSLDSLREVHYNNIDKATRAALRKYSPRYIKIT